MRDCRIRNVFIGLVPVRTWRDALLARHILGCARCREGLADIREARSVTWSKEDFEGRVDLWPRVREELLRAEAAPSGRAAVRMRWAAASAAAVALAVVAGLFLFKPDRNGVPLLSPDIKIIIESPMIYSEPAQAYIFQPRDENTTFVWVEKTNQGEKP